MPKGGRRKGAGRPTKEQQELKAKLLAETLAKVINTDPKAFLQAKLNSPGSTKYERMRAAELLLRHPPDPVSRSALPELPVKIIAIPREVFLTKEQIANIEELAAQHGQPIEPFEATPPFDAPQAAPTIATELERRDVPDDGKVAKLYPAYGRTLFNGRRLAAGPRDDDDSAA